MDNGISNDKKKSYKVIVLLLVLILLILIGFGGFYLGTKFELKGTNSNEVKDEEKNTDDDTSKDDKKEENLSNKTGIRISDLDSINYINISEALDFSGLCSNLEECTVTTNLLDNEEFKMVFAFEYGMKLYNNMYEYEKFYSNGQEVEVTGGAVINNDDFKYVYNKIYGIEINDSSVNLNSNYFVNVDNKLYGTYYTGLSEIVTFNISSVNARSGVVTSEIKNNENDSIIGKIKVTYDENKNNTINLTGIYLSK